MEHFKKYLIWYIIGLAILIWAIWYFGFRKKQLTTTVSVKQLPDSKTEIKIDKKGEQKTILIQEKKKVKWNFVSINQISGSKKQLLGGTIPHEFKAGETISLHIQQTFDYVYDVSGKIVSISDSRQSMIVEFTGKVTDKAFGQAEV